MNQKLSRSDNVILSIDMEFKIFENLMFAQIKNLKLTAAPV